MTQLPRRTGEVTVPLAVTFRMAACVSRPPRGLSFGSGTGTNSSLVTPGMPYSPAIARFSMRKSDWMKFETLRSH